MEEAPSAGGVTTGRGGGGVGMPLLRRPRKDVRLSGKAMEGLGGGGNDGGVSRRAPALTRHQARQLAQRSDQQDDDNDEVGLYGKREYTFKNSGIGGRFWIFRFKTIAVPIMKWRACGSVVHSLLEALCWGTLARCWGTLAWCRGTLARRWGTLAQGVENVPSSHAVPNVVCMRWGGEGIRLVTC